MNLASSHASITLRRHQRRRRRVASGQLGTLSSVKDGNNHTITLTNWHRSVPQSIKHPGTPEFPSGATQTAVVNDRAEITSVTSELGHTTSYGYDLMGRINAITYPTGDSTTWTSTTRSFVKVNTAEFGIPAGHWRLTEATGVHQKNTYYDALWRPILTGERDTGDTATSVSAQVGSGTADMPRCTSWQCQLRAFGA